MSTLFLPDIEAAVGVALSGITGLQVLTRETEETRLTKSAVVKAQIEKEFVPGSRIWEIGIEVEVRVNRSEYTATQAEECFQNVFATLCNTPKETIETTNVTLHSWFVGQTSSTWLEDVSIHSVHVRTHAQQVP